MKISAEEKLMYNVMKVIYESGIPISFKGSMVLEAFLSRTLFTLLNESDCIRKPPIHHPEHCSKEKIRGFS